MSSLTPLKTERGLLDVAVALAVFPEAEISVAQRVEEEFGNALLRLRFFFADGTHSGFSSSKRHDRPRVYDNELSVIVTSRPVPPSSRPRWACPSRSAGLGHYRPAPATVLPPPLGLPQPERRIGHYRRASHRPPTPAGLAPAGAPDWPLRARNRPKIILAKCPDVIPEVEHPFHPVPIGEIVHEPNGTLAGRLVWRAAQRQVDVI